MHTFRYVLTRLAGLAAITALVSACGSSAPASAPAAPAAPAANAPVAAGPAASAPAPATVKIKRGGTWNTHQPGSFAGADPAMGQNAYQLWQFVGTYMLRREPETWKLVGDAIEKWSYSTDGKELTLSVRKGVKWQNKPPVNGRDMDAKDIVYTLKSITGMQYPDLPPLRFPRRANLDGMVDAVAVDPYTVKVTLKEASSSFLDGLSEYRSPVTPDQAREFFGGRDSLANPNPDRYLSAGPFILTKYQDLQEAIYERYPDYWEKGEDGQSKPYLDRVRNIWITDVGTVNAAFIAGQVDTATLANPETRKQIMDAKKDTQALAYAPSSGFYFLAFNTTRKPFDDIRVRKAMSILLDQKEIGETMWGDLQGKPLWKYASTLAWVFPEAISQEELAKRPNYESPKSQATIDEAKKLMAEAGVDKLELDVITNTGSLNDASLLAYGQIKKVFPNITMKVQPLDNAIQLERAAKGDFDIQSYLYIHEPTAVAMLKTVYHSKGGRNSSRTKDAKIDELLDKAGVELDETKRNALLKDAQLRAFELYTAVPVTHYALVNGFSPQARGMRIGAGTQINMWAKDWWFDK